MVEPWGSGWRGKRNTAALLAFPLFPLGAARPFQASSLAITPLPFRLPVSPFKPVRIQKVVYTPLASLSQRHKNTPVDVSDIRRKS